ncbi:hypothetical protein N7457_009707 [Penicillium paradoxum]|uniref:uncharacterized protein n=1 Tax=Penicillium paradoxum TaxID=176176 RepID=UPI002548D69E|nr:uncharacterized protein N7457_009707 [Penicillium paradoxum]KAJ5774811.1 hypothetical protein N7457_009707 [Penicillium paradoxum]
MSSQRVDSQHKAMVMHRKPNKSMVFAGPKPGSKLAGAAIHSIRSGTSGVMLFPGAEMFARHKYTAIHELADVFKDH